MKNTKKQSNKTFPNIGNVSSRSITNIRIPKEKKLEFSFKISFIKKQERNDRERIFRIFLSLLKW